MNLKGLGQSFVLKEADSNPRFRGRIKRSGQYLEDGGHEDGEPRQQEHEDTGDPLLSGSVTEEKKKNTQLKKKNSNGLNVPTTPHFPARGAFFWYSPSSASRRRK